MRNAIDYSMQSDPGATRQVASKNAGFVRVSSSHPIASYCDKSQGKRLLTAGSPVRVRLGEPI
jgi:hypothetical protein